MNHQHDRWQQTNLFEEQYINTDERKKEHATYCITKRLLTQRCTRYWGMNIVIIKSSILVTTVYIQSWETLANAKKRTNIYSNMEQYNSLSDTYSGTESAVTHTWRHHHIDNHLEQVLYISLNKWKVTTYGGIPCNLLDMCDVVELTSHTHSLIV